MHSWSSELYYSLLDCHTKITIICYFNIATEQLNLLSLVILTDLVQMSTVVTPVQSPLVCHFNQNFCGLNLPMEVKLIHLDLL